MPAAAAASAAASAAFTFSALVSYSSSYSVSVFAGGSAAGRKALMGWLMQFSAVSGASFC